MQKQLDEIKKIRFLKYKSFTGDNQEEINLEAPVCLIIGRNSSGKSSIIDILETVYKNNSPKELNVDEMGIQLAFELTQNHLSAFTNYTSGGEIPGNHRYYAEKFLSNTIWGSLDITHTTNYSGNSITKRILDFVGITKNNDDSNFLPVLGEHLWKASAQSYAKYSDNIVFRRINADRDISAETEFDSFEVNYNGEGATNLIRRFINDSELDENNIEGLLLSELNKIMGEDAHFESIRIQQITQNNNRKWEIFLKEKNQNRFALSQSGSGLKTIILMLVNLHLIPSLSNNKNKYFIFAFEELENNLHPALQRRVFEYLYSYTEKNNVRIFLTSHSHVAINIFYGKEKAHIYHVIKENYCSTIKPIDSYFDKVEILEDLDVKASDILQSNGIIWVEGPSDRIYIKRWLELLTENKFKEGQDYQFLYYGGRLLSHYELGGENNIEGLISLLTTNRHAAIVIDSDKKAETDSINITKQRIKDEFKKRNGFCWITKGKEIENYLTFQSINQALNKDFFKKDVGRYNSFPNYIKKVEPNFSSKKVVFAKKIVPAITKNDIRFDLKQQVVQLYNTIRHWNS